MDEGAIVEDAGAFDLTCTGVGGSNGAAEGGMGSVFSWLVVDSRIGGCGTPATVPL